MEKQDIHQSHLELILMHKDSFLEDKEIIFIVCFIKSIVLRVITLCRNESGRAIPCSQRMSSNTAYHRRCIELQVQGDGYEMNRVLSASCRKGISSRDI